MITISDSTYADFYLYDHSPANPIDSALYYKSKFFEYQDSCIIYKYKLRALDSLSNISDSLNYYDYSALLEAYNYFIEKRNCFIYYKNKNVLSEYGLLSDSENKKLNELNKK